VTSRSATDNAPESPVGRGEIPRDHAHFGVVLPVTTTVAVGSVGHNKGVARQNIRHRSRG
jgi:hypothetical protein